MNYNKIIYNIYFFIWLAFGLIVYIYSWIEIILSKSYDSLSFTTKLKLIFPTIILILYHISYVRYKYEKNTDKNKML